LRNFMRDTANQVVLGTFVATLVYWLLVLRARERALSYRPGHPSRADSRIAPTQRAACRFERAWL